MEELPLQKLLQRQTLFLLRPPKIFFWVCYVSLFIMTCMGFAWPFMVGMSESFAAYVSFVLSFVLALVLCLPSSRDRNRQINFGFDENALYLVNGYQKRVLSLPLRRVRQVHCKKAWGDYFVLLGFTLDIALSEDELDKVQQLMCVPPDKSLEVSKGVYRLGFSANWQPAKKVYRKLERLNIA